MPFFHSDLQQVFESDALENGSDLFNVSIKLDSPILINTISRLVECVKEQSEFLSELKDIYPLLVTRDEMAQHLDENMEKPIKTIRKNCKQIDELNDNIAEQKETIDGFKKLRRAVNGQYEELMRENGRILNKVSRLRTHHEEYAELTDSLYNLFSIDKARLYRQLGDSDLTQTKKNNFVSELPAFQEISRQIAEIQGLKADNIETEKMRQTINQIQENVREMKNTVSEAFEADEEDSFYSGIPTDFQSGYEKKKSLLASKAITQRMNELEDEIKKKSYETDVQKIIDNKTSDIFEQLENKADVDYCISLFERLSVDFSQKIDHVSSNEQQDYSHLSKELENSKKIIKEIIDVQRDKLKHPSIEMEEIDDFLLQSAEAKYKTRKEQNEEDSWYNNSEKTEELRKQSSTKNEDEGVAPQGIFNININKLHPGAGSGVSHNIRYYPSIPKLPSRPSSYSESNQSSPPPRKVQSARTPRNSSSISSPRYKKTRPHTSRES
eukprot:gb/GECH01002293.1/.p1 GENE.gb/GECH01002293.1/~~gb/GECH01002293.1/.p1  ORF type:complete len:497 (+),score=149.73 gb/GECH01002293.1/:1-1491(+)